MKLVVGLGNPGARYELTRHNVGFLAVDFLAQELDTDISRLGHFSLLGEGWMGREKIILMKPQTYMNLSGKAVVSAINFFKMSHSDVMIIYDDLDLEVGRLRVRAHGSAGGHKGMGSIIQLLGSQEIPRIRIGIGRPSLREVTDYVLRSFPDEDWEVIKSALIQTSEAVRLWITDGIAPVMNRYNAPDQMNQG